VYVVVAVGIACRKVCLVRRYKKNMNDSACLYGVYALTANQRGLAFGFFGWGGGRVWQTSTSMAAVAAVVATF